MSSGLTARGESPPIPQVRDGGPSGGTDQINALSAFTSKSFPATLLAAFFTPSPFRSDHWVETRRSAVRETTISSQVSPVREGWRSWPRHEAWGRRGYPRAVATTRGQAVTAPLPPSRVTALQLGPRSLVAAVPPCPQVPRSARCPQGCEAVSPLIPRSSL